MYDIIIDHFAMVPFYDSKNIAAVRTCSACADELNGTQRFGRKYVICTMLSLTGLIHTFIFNRRLTLK